MCNYRLRLSLCACPAAGEPLCARRTQGCRQRRLGHLSHRDNLATPASDPRPPLHPLPPPWLTGGARLGGRAPQGSLREKTVRKINPQIGTWREKRQYETKLLVIGAGTAAGTAIPHCPCSPPPAEEPEHVWPLWPPHKELAEQF
ncbi:hypothetical protein Nmel_016819 [Mimus melanotis]